MFEYVCTCASDLQSLYMHEKGTLKTFGEDKKPMRNQTSTYFYLFIIKITLKSTEKLGRQEREGDRYGWRWVGGVE